MKCSVLAGSKSAVDGDDGETQTVPDRNYDSILQSRVQIEAMTQLCKTSTLSHLRTKPTVLVAPRR